jgi:hypothetical protein
VKILVVMKTRADAGNTHAIANYMHLAPQFGHEIAIYGNPIWYVTGLQFSTDIRDFDRVLYVFESDLYQIKTLQEVVMLGHFPRDKRAILDSDGMYNPLVKVNGDSNHQTEDMRKYWISCIDAIGSKVLQTTIAKPKNPHARALSFYGYNKQLELPREKAPAKEFDILHVGHNWWRWREFESELLPAFERIRDQVGEIGLVGLWWDHPPVEGPAAGPEAAFQSDPERLRRLNIRVQTAVMYNDVIHTMSKSKINIMTQRPVLRELKHLTLKYFEIFCADTIPLMMLDADHAEAVYGPAGRELVLPGHAAEKILDALQRPHHYRGIVEDVRKHLRTHFSYEQKVEELIDAIRH